MLGLTANQSIASAMPSRSSEVLRHSWCDLLTLPGFESAGILGSATDLKTIYPCGNT